MTTSDRSTSERIIDRIVRVARPMFRDGALNTKALRVELRRIAAEEGAAPDPDPRQINLFEEEEHHVGA